MTPEWRQFWTALWAIFTEIVWPISVRLFKEIMEYLIDTFYPVGGWWGVVGGGVLLVIMAGRLNSRPRRIFRIAAFFVSMFGGSLVVVGGFKLVTA
jgi:hypothetical protein